MRVNPDLFKVLRTGKKILRNNPPCSCSSCELDEEERKYVTPALTVGACMALGALLILMASCRVAHAYSEDQLVSAIGKAENSKSHPYGIMVKFKHTSPRQACLNTVRHKYQQWVKEGSQGDFIDYLAAKYAPIGASNDPTGLNKNWARNVRLFLNKGEA